MPRVEVALDAGCGSGRVTELLLERCDHVIAVDAAPSMVAHAREALGDRATVLQQDLLELSLPSPVDAAFSNAVFHWVPDHPRLFARLHEALKPGGALEAQYGGFGNVERFHEAASAVGHSPPFAEYLGGWVGPWNFTTDVEARGWLSEAGFVDVRAWLEEWPMTPREPEDYIRTVCLGHHLQRLPDELRAPEDYLGRVSRGPPLQRFPDGPRAPYVEAGARRIGSPMEIDYVRLNIPARRAP